MALVPTSVASAMSTSVEIWKIPWLEITGRVFRATRRTGSQLHETLGRRDPVSLRAAGTWTATCSKLPTRADHANACAKRWLPAA